MIRFSALNWAAFVAITVVSTVAVAEKTEGSAPGPTPVVVGQRISVVTPVNQFVPHAQISQTLYLERCRQGCVVNKGVMNDARSMISTIPTAGSHPIGEYRNGAGQTGDLANAEWDLLVKCVREVYSPYAVTVTDVKPAAGISYHAAIVAGIPQEIGFGGDVLGVAPLASDCSPQDNVISFSFANAHTQTETVSRVNNICWTAAQESAHAFGLDHQFAFLSDNRSSCNDPMTYRVDCGGQKFFRNEGASCGEFEARSCRCGTSQNSHLKIQSVFGAGTSIVAAPTAGITTPAVGTTTLGTFVGATAGSQRGVARVELYLNGFKWSEAKGVPFGQNGQLNPAAYKLDVPANVPNSIVDVKVRAFDDLENFSDSPVITVTKGAPCQTADTCAKGQKCEAGKCFWDPPTGQIGDTCTYGQFCSSGLCQGTVDQQICTQECIPGVGDSCPDSFVCAEYAPSKGICFFPEEDSGCCSTSKGHGVPWPHVAFATLVLGILMRPWRRRS